MFNYISEKIKSMAKIFCSLGIIVSIFCAVLLFMEGPQGLIVLIVGPMFSWLGSLIMYGFGELIEKVTEIAENTKKQDSDAE